MKHIILSSMLASASIGMSEAAIYRVSNGSVGSPAASGIVDSAGRAFRSNTALGDSFTGPVGGTSAGPGVLALGYFSTDSFNTFTTSSQFVSAFINFGNSIYSFATAGPAGSRGIFSFNTPSVQVTGSSFEGKNLYLFAGNGLSFAESTEFLIVKSTLVFDAFQDQIPTPESVPFSPDLGTTLFGSVIPDVKTTSSDSSVTEGWQMAIIPEPSAALLGAIGALGLLRRRRI